MALPIAVLLSGCFEEAPKAPDAGARAAPEVNDHATIQVARVEKAAATSTRTEAAAEHVEAATEEAAGTRGADCNEARWVRVKRCAYDGMLYAAGSVAGVQEIGLARSTAAERARKSLVEGDKKELEDSEVVDFVRCHGTSYALARAKADPRGAPTCDPTLLAARSPILKGCPEWVRAIAWRDQGTIAAVGAARIRNSSLAEATAANRARAELHHLVHDEPGSNPCPGTHGPGHEAHAGYSELGRERAVCDGVTYVKVVARNVGVD